MSERASISVMLNCPGSCPARRIIDGSRFAIVPMISTPVAPPPTTVTASARCLASGSVSLAAYPNCFSIARWSFMASATDHMVIACSSRPGIGGTEAMAPVAMTSRQ